MKEISLCESCHCMTKTIKGKCGKCGAEKIIPLSEKVWNDGEEGCHNMFYEEDVKNSLNNFLKELEEITSIAWYKEWKVNKFIEETDKLKNKHFGDIK